MSDYTLTVIKESTPRRIMLEVVTTGSEDREGLEILAALEEDVEQGENVDLQAVWEALMSVVGITV